MPGTVRDACKIHPMVHDYRMTEAIENLSDLITGKGDGAEFFARNYITQGMDALFRGCWPSRRGASVLDRWPARRR